MLHSLRFIRRPLRWASAAALTLLGVAAQAQTTGSVGIGTTTPAGSALLDLTSTTKGLLAPRMTATERAAIQNPVPGLLVYQTTGVQLGFWYYNGSAWTYLSPAGAGDNLGSHTATQNLDLGSNQLVGNGGNLGLSISNGGNVGIGVSTAVAPLEVARYVGSAYALFHSPGSSWFSLGSDRDDAYKIKFNDGNGFGGANYLTIDRGTSNVGIGTSSPTQKLHVAGQVYSSTGGFRFPDNTVQTTAATPSAPQTLTLSGQNLAISGGNTVTLPTGGADNLGNHTATQNLNLADKLLVGNGGSSGLSINTTGSVGIGTSSPAASALLDLTSTSKGLLPPRMTQTQRDAISAPAPGLTVYNTTSSKLEVWNGSSWGSSLMTNEAAGAPVATFAYTGAVQTWTVPAGVTTIQVDMAGAQGGTLNSAGGSGGNGARVVALVSVTPGQVLNIYVGSAGGIDVPSYNGGGYSGPNVGQGSNSSGGGASDIRIGGTALSNRILVAGGGGGGGSIYNNGRPEGGAGGFNGNVGGVSPGLAGATGGGGGTQTAGGGGGGTSGTLGQGGHATNGNGGGGGGGYYGGGGGSNYAGGGGGSSYANPTYVGATQFYTGAQGGNGYVNISMVSAPYLALNNAQVNQPDGAVLFPVQGKLGGDAANLFWNNSAKRLGIGTSTPGATLDVNGGAAITGATTLTGNLSVSGPVSFGASTRQMLNLWNTQYGIGVQTNTQYFRSGEAFAWYNGGVHNDTQFDAGGGTQQMMLKNGRLGIGAGFSNAALPNAALEIRQANPYLVLHAPNMSWMHMGLDANDSYKFKIGEGAAFSGNTSGPNWLTISNANVGIGTTSPAFPLDIQKTVTPGNYAYAYFAANADGTATSGSTGSSTGPVSIRATGRVLATEFNATSDRRLKSIIGLSDQAADLALLTRIRITDYTMRDRVQYGQRQFKKVIAQEVEQVFPQAVSQHRGFVPDIYALATAATLLPGDSLVQLTLPAAPAVTTQAGQRIKLIGTAGEVTGAVVRASGMMLVVRGARAVAGQQTFVFGLEHADVRSVDYEALAMLNVSATQELARQLIELQKQNLALQQQVTVLQAAATSQDQTNQLVQTQAAQTAELAQRLKALEALLGARAEAK